MSRNTIIGCAAGLALGILAPPVLLGAVGFSAGGVVGGSIAAAVQSSIGNVAAGSLFAACQSAGAAGISAATTAAIASTTAGVGGTIGYLISGSEDCSPEFNEQLFELITDYLAVMNPRFTAPNQKLSLAVDVSSKSGKANKSLDGYFTKRASVDMSGARIGEKFRMSKEADASAELVTVGMVLHLLDWPSFYQEVDRVLKPGGVIAVYMHSLLPIITDHSRAEMLNECVVSLLRNDAVLNYWDNREKYLHMRYTEPEMQIPYPGSKRDERVKLTIKGTISSLLKYLRATPPVSRYLNDSKEEGEMFWKESVKRFCNVYGSDKQESTLSYKFDVCLLLGRKPM